MHWPCVLQPSAHYSIALASELLIAAFGDQNGTGAGLIDPSFAAQLLQEGRIALRGDVKIVHAFTKPVAVAFEGTKSRALGCAVEAIELL